MVGTHGPTILPRDAPFWLLQSAEDLGTAVRYRGLKVLGCIRARLDEGHARLHRLVHQPRPVGNKARMIQASVWPSVFRGTEGKAMSQKHVAGSARQLPKPWLGATSR